jgi:pimeloyl-ACP methyl ester carboxylesterase
MVADDYAEIVHAYVADRLDHPVLVAHSGAGLLLPAIAKRLTPSRLVWLAAAIPDFATGRPFVEVIRSESDLFTEEWRALREPPTADAVLSSYFLFHDCDLATLRWALTTVRLFQPAAVYSEPAPSRPACPSTYVLPREDRILTPAWMRRAAREQLGTTAVEVDGGHCPHVSRPSLIAELISS